MPLQGSGEEMGGPEWGCSLTPRSSQPQMDGDKQLRGKDRARTAPTLSYGPPRPSTAPTPS